MKTAVCYFRKSIEYEAEKSIERQREIAYEYAKNNGIQIVGEYSEVGSSATINRPELQRMLQDVSQLKTIDYILVYSFDRITREVDDLGWILTQLKKVMKVKTRVHSMTEENDYEDDHFKLFLVMMRTFGSTQERINTVNRLQDSRRRKQKKGGYVGGKAPFGYYSVKGSGKLHIHEDEMLIVKTAFILRKGKHTMQEIADELNNAGFRTRRGKEFSATTVQRILKNKNVYEGKTLAPGIF